MRRSWVLTQRRYRVCLVRVPGYMARGILHDAHLGTSLILGSALEYHRRLEERSSKKNAQQLCSGPLLSTHTVLEDGMKTSFHACIVIGSALFVFTAAAGLAEVTAIKAGRLVDPEKGTTLAAQILLIEGPKITGVGADLPIPAGATVIDLSSSTVMPGLIDSHTHMLLTMDPDEHGGSYHVTTLVNSTAYRAIEGVANARSMLEHGFTTIRDLGNNGNHGDTDLRRAIEGGVGS